MQPAIGVSTGIYQTIAGTAELGAALSDLYLDTDALSKVEKALPAIDLMDVYGDSRGSSCQVYFNPSSIRLRLGHSQKRLPLKLLAKWLRQNSLKRLEEN